jgi:uncharacterized protein (TIGR00730 family)
MESLCVYCGSSLGERPLYQQAAQDLGTAIAEQEMTLVYGGANVGLMGILADAVLTAGGKVVGVIPQSLIEKEVAHWGLSELKIVNSMHERKALMADLADGFMALPGGLGTLDELCEILTWAQLGFHHKACGLLNLGGFYDPLLTFLDHAVTEGFLPPRHRQLIITGDEPKALLTTLIQTESFA